MSAESEAQRRWAGAELARKRAGKRTESGMNEKQLRDFARKPTRSSSRSKRRSPRS
jgi:hypothetical protein